MSTKPEERPEETPENAAGSEPANATEASTAPTPEATSESAVAPERDPEAEIAQLKDQLLRALAELDNLRKRAERERLDTAKYAISGFARDLLAVADNLRRALDSVPDEALKDDAALQALAEGVDLTERELMATFERHGIEKITPEPGDKFNPHQHQAMFEVEDPEKPAGTIVQVLQSGYRIHDRLLRAAMVGVSKGGPSGSMSPGVDTTA